MNAIRRESDGLLVCPHCSGYLEYWTAYDILLCPVCLQDGYDPDTGIVQGPVE